MRGALTASGLDKGRLGGPGIPLSPIPQRSIDLQARCSKQVAEEPLIPQPGGVQESDARRQSDTSRESFCTS